MNQPFIDLLTPFLPNLGDRPLTEDSRLHDLGMNSMKAIDLLFAIEDGLGVSLPDEDLNDTTFATAGSLWAAVQRAQGAAEGDRRAVA
ncbi:MULTISPECIES: acyl carrier protein [unclassified Streptomyces]|uniref:acyl carrier protein n=1 Tax=unclassified Streptomyces TaxID=2593676 RepID=UPI0036E36849